MADRKFEIVADEQTPEPSGTSTSEGALTAALFLFLKTLSQRTVVAIADCFTLITVALVFYLWLRIIGSPSYEQIGSLTIFSIFVIAVNLIVRRR